MNLEGEEKQVIHTERAPVVEKAIEEPEENLLDEIRKKMTEIERETADKIEERSNILMGETERTLPDYAIDKRIQEESQILIENADQRQIDFLL